jgi:uncharacterized membrane protein YphA (DoxX/SURF4 family)
MSDTTPSVALHRGLWAAQIFLGLAFFAAGSWKTTTPLPDLEKALPWVATSPSALVRFIGISELLGGIGLILPSALRILPRLTPLAGALLALVMVLAAGFHASRGEFGGLPVNAFLGGVALFIAWGRTVPAPISPK